MAKIIFSGLVTSIVGSVGGTTIKRTKNGYAIGRKSNGYSKSILLKNNALGVLRQARNLYSQLNTSQKQQWNDLSQSIPFVNSFGETYYLTGRMFFIKVQSPLIRVNKPYTDPTDFTQNIPAITITNFSANLTGGDFSIDIDYTGPECNFFISFDYGTEAHRQPIFNRKKILARYAFSIPTVIDLSDIFIARYPYAQTANPVRVYVTACNEWGHQIQGNYADAIIL